MKNDMKKRILSAQLALILLLMLWCGTYFETKESQRQMEQLEASQSESGASVDDYKDAEEQINECRQYSVEELFCCAYAPYFWQAIQIRYPETVCPVWRSRLMLKVRLMGTKNDIKWFGKILQRNPKIEVTEFSDLYPNKGTKKFHRAYVEVRKSNVKENQ